MATVIPVGEPVNEAERQAIAYLRDHLPASYLVLHKFNSPAWLKHIQKANAALGTLTPEKMANLRPGEAFIWSSKASDEAFTKSAVKIRCRPRVTQHGGATKTAVG
jgi:DNA phosphorothioation-dependent restriction protein DptH